MIDSRHDATSYGKPSFKHDEDDSEKYTAVLRRSVDMQELGAPPGLTINLGDSDRAPEDFEELRHRLAMRRIRGELLSATEDAVLLALESQAAAFLPAPESRSVQLEAAVGVGRRLLARLAGGDD